MAHWRDFVDGTPEHDRLVLLELLFDPNTLRHIDRIGMRPGWQCLEVGAGAGSIARALAERGGDVIATDIRMEPLEPLKELGITVLHHDITKDDAPGEFDLIHARYVLDHLPARETAMQRMVSWLKPGGWLVIESGSPITQLSPFPVFRKVVYAAVEVWVDALGTAITFGRSLPLPLIAAGLQDCDAEGNAPPILGGSAMAAWVQATVHLGAVKAVEDGRISQDEVDEAYAILTDPSHVDYSWLGISAWGRKA
jgi:SAM-dependent methyltransferase